MDFAYSKKLYSLRKAIRKIFLDLKFIQWKKIRIVSKEKRKNVCKQKVFLILYNKGSRSRAYIKLNNSLKFKSTNV